MSTRTLKSRVTIYTVLTILAALMAVSYTHLTLPTIA